MDVEVRLCHAADLILACLHEDRAVILSALRYPTRQDPGGGERAFTSRRDPRLTTAERREIEDRLGVGRPSCRPSSSAATMPKSRSGTVHRIHACTAGSGGSVRHRRRCWRRGQEGWSRSRQSRRDGRPVRGCQAGMALGCGYCRQSDVQRLGHQHQDAGVHGLGLADRDHEGGRARHRDGEHSLSRCRCRRFRDGRIAPGRQCARPRELSEATRTEAEPELLRERISANAGRLLQHRHQALGRPVFFSIVVPTVRATRASVAADAAAGEVRATAISRSSSSIRARSRGPTRTSRFGFRLTYVHTDVRGAVPARNAGADLAVGEVIAFTDDDCEPGQDWLASARPLFDDPGVVGVEASSCPTGSTIRNGGRSPMRVSRAWPS